LNSKKKNRIFLKKDQKIDEEFNEKGFKEHLKRSIFQLTEDNLKFEAKYSKHVKKQ